MTVKISASSKTVRRFNDDNRSESRQKRQAQEEVSHRQRDCDEVDREMQGEIL